jgi:hypothetical protein
MKQSFIIPIICLVLTSCGLSPTPNIPTTTTHELLGGLERGGDDWLNGTYLVLTQATDACVNDDHFSSIAWQSNTNTNAGSELNVIYINNEQLKSSFAFQEIQKNGIVQVSSLDEVPNSLEIHTMGERESMYSKLTAADFRQLEGENNCYDSPYNK